MSCPPIGYRCGMQRVERKAVIGASPAVVFAYLSDLDNLAEWQTGVVSALRTCQGAPVTREVSQREALGGADLVGRRRLDVHRSP